MPRSTKRVVECQVIQPDKVLYSFGVPENCKGQDCLNKVILDIEFAGPFQHIVAV